VQALEDALGVPLFVRRHRALALTAVGAAFHRDVAAALGALISAADAARGAHRTPGLTLSTTVSFASLWVIPRLPAFRARHPDVEVYVSADDRLIDLGRGDVDVAVRYLADSGAPERSVRLFGERMLPVAAPELLKRRNLPLTKPSDLAHHVLLHLDDPDGRMPWLDWNMWLTSNGQSGLKPAGSLRFKLYDQVIQAAVGGQGRARPHTVDCRVPARRSPRGAVSEALRVGAGLLRGGGAARGRAARCRRVRRLAARRGRG
jgi:DNA-binding transcriptional LysR family regulator